MTDQAFQKTVLQEFSSIKQEFSDVNKRLDTIDQRLDTMKIKIVGLKEEQVKINDTISENQEFLIKFIQEAFTQLNDNIKRTHDFELRIQRIEKKLDIQPRSFV